MDLVKIFDSAPTDATGVNEYLRKLGVAVELNETHAEIMINELNRYNRLLGLSGVKERNEVFAKHFYESALLAAIVGDKCSVRCNSCDLGTGNGFPGLVLASIFNDWKFTFIESSSKRAAYLENLIVAMKIKNAVIENIFLDKLPNYLRSKFDIVTHRAFAPLRQTLKLVSLIGTERHITAGFLTEKPIDSNLNNYGYKIDKLIEYRNYKNQVQYVYSASLKAI